MAGKQVQRRRGTTAQHTPFIGAMGEVTVDTVKFVEVVHDGATPGGFPQASARDIVQVGVDTDSKLALKVSQDSAVGAAKIPKGTTAQRPASPQVGDFRYNSTTKKFEGYADPTLGWAPVGGDSIPMYSVFWVPLRTAVPAGFVVADGQTLSRATYPDAWAGIEAGNTPLVTEAAWLADAGYHGAYSPGDGATTFRIPDYNGKAAGSHGAVFLRGDGLNSNGTDGIIQRDQFQGHGHAVFIMATGSGGGAYNFAGNVQTDSETVQGNTMFRATGPMAYTHGAPRFGAETRPVNVTGCWCIKLFGAIINPGAADAAQLATEVANIKSTIQNNMWQRNTALAPVSQAAGMPTGGLMYAGNNANGFFIRLADGTQFCATQGQPMVPAAGIGLMAWSFPIAFSAGPPAILPVGSIGAAADARGYIAHMQYQGVSAVIANFVTYCASQIGWAAFAMGRWF
jgi:hypothetical protein